MKFSASHQCQLAVILIRHHFVHNPLQQPGREQGNHRRHQHHAHRFSSVVDCDEILYMKDGAITERGTFQELMELGGSFAHIYRVQQEQHADLAMEILCFCPPEIPSPRSPTIVL